MGRYPFTARRAIFSIVATLVASLVVSVSGAEAVVVNDTGTVAGASLLPSSRFEALPAGVAPVTDPASCTDPWLSPDLGGPAMPSPGLCDRGGAVMHKNEVFSLAWDQHRSYWSETRGYVEQFLRDVADSHGSLGSPYALTTQYNDAGGRAQNSSSFGGGCIDYGTVGGSACEFGNVTGAGHNYPVNGCTAKGDSFVGMSSILANNSCFTDGQLQGEVATMVAQTGILRRTTPGYTPLVTLLLPPGVETCLDAARKLCSSNAYLTPPPPQVSADTSAGTISAGTYRVAITYTTVDGEQPPTSMQTVKVASDGATLKIKSPPNGPNVTGWSAYVTDAGGLALKLQTSLTPIGTDVALTALNPGGAPPSQPAFCSYHSQVSVGGTPVAYVVQPWTAGTGCDEPDVPTIADAPTPHELSVDIGQRLVSPLSQSHIAAIVNPGLGSWVANNTGAEIDDNGGCQPLANGLDSVSVGSSGQNPYYLQREYNNAAALEFEPNTYFGCAPNVILNPSFVVPSAVNQGDVVQFDGSATASTLIVPNAKYMWNFGDNTPLTVGASLVHTFARAGTYTVILTVVDRGGNAASYSQPMVVLTAGGTPATPPPAGGGGGGSATPLSVHMQLLPASLRTVLSHGVRVRVTSNQAANGLVTVSITRAAARRAHIPVGRSGFVVIGRGTVSQVRKGTITLRLGLSPRMTRKLHSLRHVALTVRLALVPKAGRRVAIVIAGVF